MRSALRIDGISSLPTRADATLLLPPPYAALLY